MEVPVAEGVPVVESPPPSCPLPPLRPPTPPDSHEGECSESIEVPVDLGDLGEEEEGVGEGDAAIKVWILLSRCCNEIDV